MANKVKVLVTGTSGQLGFAVMNELTNHGFEGIGLDKNETIADFKHIVLDITDRKEVMRVVKELKPDAIVHCAAWTKVDAAELSENMEVVRAINVEGTKYLVDACKSVDAKFVYLSTDYVFSGDGEKPWSPDDNKYAPINVYGRSKLDGELIVSNNLEKYFIIRIAWVFGEGGENFVKTMVNVGKTHKEVSVIDDQIGTPTYTVDLAKLIVDMIETDKYGYYHATNEGGYISWADFAEEIFKVVGMDVKVVRLSSEEYERKMGKRTIAKRPHNSRLEKRKLKENGFKPLPDWRDALQRYICCYIKGTEGLNNK